MPGTAPIRRLHRGTEDEDAAQLKLGISSLYTPPPPFDLDLTRCKTGHEFNEADTLTASEAKLLIDVVLTQRPKDTGEDMPLTEYHPLIVALMGRVMKKTQEYLTTFARFKSTEAIHSVERYVLYLCGNDIDV
jgi:hypothetical protein